MTLGTEVLFERDLLRGRTIGLVSNPASVTATLDHVVDAAEAHGVRVGALFGPQHGFRSVAQENMIESPHAEDPRRHVPIYSLYSETRQPTAAMLAGLDALVIDLQDVGTRIYTYIYTMAACLRAAKTQGLPVVVCDRPNPISGDRVEGPMLDPAFASFVGEYPIPMRHGMTIGELARLFNDHFGIGAKLEVVAMRGWSRARYFDETGLTWVLPSPNMKAKPHAQKSRPQRQVSTTHSMRTLTVSRVRQNPASSMVKPTCIPKTRNAATSVHAVLTGLTISLPRRLGSAAKTRWPKRPGLK